MITTKDLHPILSATFVIMLVLSGIVFLGSEKSGATTRNVTVTITFWYVTILDPVEAVGWDAEIFFKAKWAVKAGDWSNFDTTSWFSCDDAGSQSDHGARTEVPVGKDTLSKSLSLTIANSNSYDVRIYMQVWDDDNFFGEDLIDDQLDASPHPTRSSIDIIYNTAEDKLKVWKDGEYNPVGGNQWSAWQNCGNNMITCSGEGAPDGSNNADESDVLLEFKITDDFNYAEPSIPSPTGDSNWQKLPVTFTWAEPTVSNSQCIIDHYTWKIDSGTTQNTNDRTVTIAAGILSGTHTFYVMTVDDIGGESAYGSFEFKIDETPPSQPGIITAPVGWTNDNTPDFSWVAATDTHSGIDGYSYMVDNPPDNSKETATTSCTIALVLDGPHTFYVKATDKLENWGDAMDVSFSVDATPPNIPTIISSSHSDENTWYSDNDPSFSWTEEGGPSPVIYYYDLDNSDPSTSIDVATKTLSDVSDGEHIFYVKASDTGGSSNTASYQIKVDVTPPSKPIDLSITPTDWTNTNSFSASWTNPSETDNSDIKSGAYYYFGDSHPSSSDGKWLDGNPITIIDAPEGESVVYIWLVDEVSNTNCGNFVTGSLRLDSIAPRDLTLTINNDLSVTSSLSTPLALSAVDDTSGLNQMCFSNNGLIWSDWEPWNEYKSWDLSSSGGNSDAGTKTVYFKVKDSAGNEKETTGTIEYNPDAEDNVPPQITSKAPMGVSENDKPTIEATFSDPSGIDTTSIVLKLDDVDITDDATITASSITYEVTTPLSKGSHTVELKVADSSAENNLATVTWSFTIGSGPIITDFSPSGMIVEKKPNILAHYTANAGIDTSSVVIMFDGNDITSDCMVDPKGFSYNVQSSLSESTYKVSLKVADNNGAELTKTWSFTVIGADIFPPEILDLKPSEGEKISESEPIISASYSDERAGGSEIDKSSVVVKLDGVDITKDCSITKLGFSYETSSSLTFGKHTVEIKVSDALNNEAQKSWEFTIADMVSPEVSLVSPIAEINTKEVIIEVSYTDENTGNSGIDTSSIVLKIDDKDITQSSTITSTKISYTSKELKNGKHKIFIEVGDKEGNVVTKEWSFTLNVADDAIDEEGGLSGGISNSVLIIIGVIVVLFIFALIFIIIRKKGKKDKSMKDSKSPPQSQRMNVPRPPKVTQQIKPQNAPPRPPSFQPQPPLQPSLPPPSQPSLPPPSYQPPKTHDRSEQQLDSMFDLNKPSSQPSSQIPSRPPEQKMDTLMPIQGPPPQEEKISDSQISMCPFCGKNLNFAKTPKFCPYCREQIIS